MNSKVVYTCITGGYDNPHTPVVKEEGWDYVCFTDNSALKSDVWDVRLITNEDKLDSVRLARQVKILGYKFLPDYEELLWVDGGYRIDSYISPYLNKVNPEHLNMALSRHPRRNCVYEEAEACKKHDRDSKEIIDRQVAKYKLEGFPEQFGLVETGLLYRRSTPYINDLMESWWLEVLAHSRRDQISFSYNLWKQRAVPFCFYDPALKSELVTHLGHNYEL